MYSLHPDFETTSFYVEELELCELRLHNCKSNPWLILIPMIGPDIKELDELSPEQQLLLLGELNLVSKLFKQIFRPQLLNIGKLGNVTPQLHFHIIARYRDDPYFPNPIWGQKLEPMADSERVLRLQQIQNGLMNCKY